MPDQAMGSIGLLIPALQRACAMGHASFCNGILARDTSNCRCPHRAWQEKKLARSWATVLRDYLSWTGDFTAE
jgi:hypothetical protein